MVVERETFRSRGEWSKYVSDQREQVRVCRRYQCGEPALWRRMCAAHWARWQNGVDPLDQPGDDGEVPERQVWQPPLRDSSVSQRKAPGRW